MNALRESAGLRVINAVGYATRVGGSRPAPAVLRAMREAQRHYYRIDDLLELASARIAAATGAEAGIVTAGACAALTLGAAAILAGDDVRLMDRLPDVAGLERKVFLYPERKEFDYDHAVRCAGARLDTFSFAPWQLEERLLRAIGREHAGVVYVWKHREDAGTIRRVAKVCRARGVPMLLDAAMSLPPGDNLRGLIALGPDLVALSGGKHLEGPQNSGLLFGRERWIRSAWMQMVDMDVRADSWARSEWMERGLVQNPPRHGIGRGCKVGKDTILGCLAALEDYPLRDFDREARRWHVCCRALVEGIGLVPGLRFSSLAENATGQFPVVEVRAESAGRMSALKRHLQATAPKIILAEHESDSARAFIYPMCLGNSEVSEIVRRVKSFDSA